MALTGDILHYRIIGPVGKGGMGEVYAAEDTRLHRKVAIKILPEILAVDPERRQRFEREAQAIAALNHPNIVTIYSVEEANGIPFLTMELVEGKLLNDLIPTSGMPPDRLVKIGVAIADALAAAQQRGITHRDLKPANVMITPDNRVKILDFGLAKLHEPAAAAEATDVTRMAPDELTGEGKIIGTVAYMSPEQAEGKPVDPRSDIFSLGVLIHEMATGQRPFKGDTNVSIISAILKDNPSSITDLNPTLPPDLSRVVRRCLAKDPSRRFQSAADLRSELEDIGLGLTMASGVASGIVPRPDMRRSRRAPMVWAAVAIVILAAAGIAYFAASRNRASGSATAAQAFVIDHFTRLTNTGTANVAALSRDGRYVVHVKTEGNDPSLWVRQTATTSDVRIVPPQPVVYDGLTFSPDGNFIYYSTYQKPGGGIAVLYKIPVLGGSAAAVVQDIDSIVSFSPDGSQLSFVRGVIDKGTNAIMLAAADGSNLRELASLKLPERFQNEVAAWSPDGKTIVASGVRGDAKVAILAVDVATAAVTPVGSDWVFVRDLQWMPDGRSIIVNAIDASGTTTTPQLWQVAFPSGTRTRVTNDLNSYIGVSLSGDGRAIATVQGEINAGISVFAHGDREWRQITMPSRRGDGVGGVARLPDGRIVYSAAGNSIPQLWVMNGDGSQQQQIANLQVAAAAPAVSVDGRWIYFQGFGKEGVCIYRVAPDGSGLQQLTHGGDEQQPIVSRDGKAIYVTLTRSGQPHPARMPADGGEPVQISDAYLRVTQLSPDGTKLLGQSWDFTRRRPSMGMLPADGRGSVQLLPELQLGSQLLADGSVVYPDRRSRPVTFWVKPPNGPARPFAPPLQESVFSGACAPDGKSAVVSSGHQTTDVVLIAAPTAPARQP